MFNDLAARQLRSEAAKCNLDAKMPRGIEAKSDTEINFVNSSNFRHSERQRKNLANINSIQLQGSKNSLTEKNLFTHFPIHLFTLKRVAFTLAEILITLGIIGVVAALTLPTVIMKYQENVRVAQLKKAYASISGAYVSILNEEGNLNDWDNIETWDDIAENFAKHINKAKVCKHLQDGCFAPVSRTDLTGNKVDNIAYYSSIIFNDGTVIGFDAQVPLEEAKLCKRLDYCFNIVVDINGDKSPNQYGVDTFTFHVGRDNILPRGAANTHGRQVMCDPKGHSDPGWWNGSGCGAWVLYNENMDYLKCVKGNQKYCNQDYFF